MKNMIAENQKIFALLKARVDFDSEISQRKIFNGRRHIKTNDEEKSWLKELLVISRQSIFSPFQGAICKFQDSIFFVYVGNNVDVDFEGLEPVELNAGIFTSLICDLNISVVGEPIDVFNTVFIQDKEDENKKESLVDWAYDWEDLKILFTPFCIFRIDKNSPFYNDNADSVVLSRLITYFLIKNRIHITLEFQNVTFADYEKMVLESPDFPYDNLLSSLIAYKWKYAFLEIYRSLEQLFSMVKLRETHEKINAPISLLDFARFLEDDLGWKPKDDDAIKDIIERSPEEIKNMLEAIKVGTEYETYNVEKFFYKTRNNIVHFRALQKEIDFDVSKWNSLLQVTLRLARHWYAEYDNYKKNYVKPSA